MAERASTSGRTSRIRRSLERRTLGVIAILCLVGVATTLAISNVVHDVDVEIDEARRSEAALDALRPVVARVRSHVSELSALRRFVALTDPMARSSFRDFVDGVDSPASSTEWIRAVPIESLGDAERSLRAEHGRAIAITPSTAARDRGVAYVEWFARPDSVESNLAGTDAMRDPERLAHLDLAARARSGKAFPVSTDSAAHGSGTAVVFVEPVYEDTARERLRGFVVSTMAAPPAGVSFDDPRRDLVDARIRIRNRIGGRVVELHASGATRDGASVVLASRSVEFGRGIIDIDLVAPSRTNPGLARFDPLTFVLGIAITIGLAVLVYSQLSLRQTVRQAEDERATAEDAAEAIDAERTRWQSALTSAGDGLWDWNAITNRVYFSPRWKQMLGFDEHEIGDGLEEWSSRVHPDDLPKTMAALEAHFRGETETYEDVHRLLCKDGTYRFILDRGRVIEWSSPGKPARMIGTHTDVDRSKRLETSLARANAFLESISRAATDVSIITTDCRGTITSFNVGAERLLGYGADELVGTATPERFHDPAEVRARSDELFAETGTRYEGFEVFVAHTRTRGSDVRMWKYIRKDGSVRSVRLMVVAMRDENDEIFGYVGMAMDMTREIEQAKAIEASAELLRKLSEQVPGVIYQYRRWPDGRACFPFASDGIADIYDVEVDAASVTVDDVMNRIHPDDLDGVVASIRDSERRLTRWVHEYRNVLPHRGVRWVRGEAQPERLEDGSTLWHGYISDITKMKALELELVDHANRDPLTRAFNRRHLERSIEDDLVRVRTEGVPLSVIMLDIDDFKRVNDTCGHHQGDRVLVRFVETLKENVRTSDRVYRTGGEELVVVCPGTDASGAELLAIELLDRLRSLQFDCIPRVTASLGVAQASPSDSLASLLERADACVYAAKAAGKNRVSLPPAAAE